MFAFIGKAIACAHFLKQAIDKQILCSQVKVRIQIIKASLLLDKLRKWSQSKVPLLLQYTMPENSKQRKRRGIEDFKTTCEMNT